MSDEDRLLITMFLLPIVWALLSIYVFRPVERLVNKHLPPKIAKFLTKTRGE
jgi:predicted PurR-regulated permease PerM